MARQPQARKPAAANRPPPLAAGDIVPSLRLQGAHGEWSLHADDVAGHFIVLIASEAAHAAALAKGADLLQDTRIHAVRPGGPARSAQPGELFDPAGQLPALLGAASGTLVIGPNLHAVAVLTDGTPEDQLARALDIVRPRAEARDVIYPRPHPPVLIVPDVLSPSDCQRLITIFKTDGNHWVEPGHDARMPPHDYKMRIPEHGRQDRVDHWVVNKGTNQFIDERLGRRLFPEIQKSFHYRITKREPYRITRYEGDRGGAQKGHRDNSAPHVAHRRFAVSVNLNSEEYEGGELRFLEFGQQRYKAPSGAAIVFSSSLLHEVMEMRSGRRFVLLAFLFGDH